MDRLGTLLKSLSHFDLSGQIDDIQPIPKGVGVTCDVFVGYWRVGQKQVAIKKLRVFLSKKEDTAKVSRTSILSKITSDGEEHC